MNKFKESSDKHDADKNQKEEIQKAEIARINAERTADKLLYEEKLKEAINPAFKRIIKDLQETKHRGSIITDFSSLPEFRTSINPRGIQITIDTNTRIQIVSDHKTKGEATIAIRGNKLSKGKPIGIDITINYSKLPNKEIEDLLYDKIHEAYELAIKI